MMNKKLIVEMLKESDAIAKKRSYMYEHANANEKSELIVSYLSAMAEYDARVQMVLAFGYMVERDDNYKIKGIKRVK